MVATSKHEFIRDFFYDAYMYRTFPLSFFLIFSAMVVCSFFLCIYGYGVLYGICLFLGLFLMKYRFLSLSSIQKVSSANNFGWAWGILVSIFVSFLVFVRPYQSIEISLLFCLLVFFTMISTKTNPNYSLIECSINFINNNRNF